MKICRSDWSAGESGNNGGFARLGGYGEDSMDCLPTYFEIVIEPVSCDWVCTGVCGCERSFEIGWSFGWRIALFGSRVFGSMLWRGALSVLSQRVLIFAEGLPFDSDPALSLWVKPSGTGMFALIVTPTFSAEADLPRSRLTS